MAAHLVTAATLDLFSFQELCDHARFSEESDKPAAFKTAKAAVAYVEGYCRRALLTSTWRMQYHGFPRCFYLDRPSWQSVTSITYIDTAGDTQTLATDQYRFNADTGKITPAYSVSWPTTQSIEDSVTVTFVSGWTTAALVPADVKQAVLMMFAHLWENREATNQAPAREVELSVRALLGPYEFPGYG